MIFSLRCYTFSFSSGTKRFDSEKAGDREVQRTMLELLNQLDGFSSNADIKVGTRCNKCVASCKSLDAIGDCRHQPS
jgi:ATP-dependent 26S proteasome regulatory subunit